MDQLMFLAQEGVAQEGMAGLFGGLAILWLLLAVVGLVLWIWALVSAIQNPALDSTMRIVWILVIIFTGFIGAIIYLLVARNSRPSSL